jgi:lysophospholipase L1-like esterase
MITVQYNGYASAASSQARAEATIAYGKSMGVPVIDMFSKGGNNAITASSLTLDGTHPSPWGFAHFYGPVIAQGVQEIF